MQHATRHHCEWPIRVIASDIEMQIRAMKVTDDDQVKEIQQTHLEDPALRFSQVNSLTPKFQASVAN